VILIYNYTILYYSVNKYIFSFFKIVILRCLVLIRALLFICFNKVFLRPYEDVIHILEILYKRVTFHLFTLLKYILF